jgi:amidohydrolase
VKRPRRLLAIIGILSVGLWVAGSLVNPAWADEKKIVGAIDAVSDRIHEVSKKIHEWKEIGQQEFKSSGLLMEELRRLGFTVTGDLKVPPDITVVKDGIARTAFRAELKGKGPGPTVTIMLEYDAMPNGHSCGHNLIATSGLMAAAGLAQVMAETPGRVLVMGTPDEENGSLGGGKVGLVEGGHFEGSDVVLITHGADRWSLDQRLLGSKRAYFTFKGKAAHAAAAPHKGVNALDATVLTYSCVGLLRQQLRQDVRVHSIVDKGGVKTNIIPDMAQATFHVRALDLPTLNDAYKKVHNCAQAGALGTGATLEFKEPRIFSMPSIDVPVFTNLVLEKVKASGVPDNLIRDQEELASSDLGRVGNSYPTVNLWFKAAPDGVALHSDQMREAAGSEEAWKATVIAGKAVALSAYELLTHPEKVKAIQEQFNKIKGGDKR